MELPLFPLQAVLLPGARLALRIFEPRYVDLVRDCARDGSGFGVCAIAEGSEVGAPPSHAASPSPRSSSTGRTGTELELHAR